MPTPNPLPDNYCDPAYLDSMREFHNKVSSGGFRNTDYRYAVRWAINSLLDKKVPVQEWDLYLALWHLINIHKVDISVVLKYLEEEFATGYDRCIIYANEEWSDMFNEEWLQKLNIVIDSLEQNPREYSHFIIMYEQNNKIRTLREIPVKETAESTANHMIGIFRLLRSQNQENPIKIIDIIPT